MTSRINRRSAFIYVLVVVASIGVGIAIGRVPSGSPIPWLLAGPALVLFVPLVARRPDWTLCALAASVVLGLDRGTLSLGAADLRITDLFYVALVIWVIFERRREPGRRSADVGQRQMSLWLLGLAISLFPVAVVAPGDIAEPLLAVLRLVETLSLVWIVPFVVRRLRDLHVVFGLLGAVLTYEVGRSIISSAAAGGLSESLEGANSKNTMGLLAVLIVILALAAPGLPALGRTVMLVVGVSGLVLARSIGSIAALALALGFFGLFQVRSPESRRAKRLLTLPRLLVLAALALMLTSLLRPENVATSGQINQSTTVHRQVLATAGFNLFTQDPIVGVGWSRSPVEIGSERVDEALRDQFGDSVNPEFFPSKNPTNVHNAYVEVLAETGLVGVVLFLVFVITAFRRIRVILHDPTLSTGAVASARCAAAIVLAIAVWFNDNAVFGNQAETVFLAIMLGILAAIPGADRRTTAALEPSAPGRPVDGHTPGGIGRRPGDEVRRRDHDPSVGHGETEALPQPVRGSGRGRDQADGRGHGHRR
jgi:O-antigen ligase